MHNYRVVACDAASGGARWFFGRQGSGDGELSSPAGLALSRCDRERFVADKDNDRVVMLAVEDGSALRSWAVARIPRGVGLGPDGRLFVTSPGHQYPYSSRRLKFSYSAAAGCGRRRRHACGCFPFADGSAAAAVVWIQRQLSTLVVVICYFC
jgi:hypothetical protein